MKVIVINDYEVSVKEIKNDLQSLQEIVGGYIECINHEGFIFIVNEEGKIKGLNPTLDIGYDVLFGNVIICNVDEDGEFSSLTEDDINDIMWSFA